MKVLNQAFGENWALYHGDSVEVLSGLGEGTVDMAIYSPPFLSHCTHIMQVSVT